MEQDCDRGARLEVNYGWLITGDRDTEMRSHIFLNLSCILIMVISLSVITVISPMPGRVLAQTNSSEIGKVLVDDIIQALKANDVKKANVHLSIFDQQLQSPSNNSSPV